MKRQADSVPSEDNKTAIEILIGGVTGWGVCLRRLDDRILAPN
jgi:hypothetical protein